MNMRNALDRALAVNPGGLAIVRAQYGSAELDLSSVDTMACELSGITFSPTDAAAIGPSNLRAIADELVAKLRYLSEPLTVIECDEAIQAAQLRSSPPRQDEKQNKLSYFECLVRPSQLSLVRVERTEEGGRRLIPFRLTREMLLQAICDIDASCKPKPVAAPPRRESRRR
jgi:hypothetical protein